MEFDLINQFKQEVYGDNKIAKALKKMNNKSKQTLQKKEMKKAWKKYFIELKEKEYKIEKEIMTFINANPQYCDKKNESFSIKLKSFESNLKNQTRLSKSCLSAFKEKKNEKINKNKLKDLFEDSKEMFSLIEKDLKNDEDLLHKEIHRDSIQLSNGFEIDMYYYFLVGKHFFEITQRKKLEHF